MQGSLDDSREFVSKALNSVPFDQVGPTKYVTHQITHALQVRVVILGQDPYINQGEAMGLSFSVPPGVRVPPSLANMYKELAADLGCKTPNHGCLEKVRLLLLLLLLLCNV
jgi:uracil DNA glycosylase